MLKFERARVGVKLAAQDAHDPGGYGDVLG